MIKIHGSKTIPMLFLSGILFHFFCQIFFVFGLVTFALKKFDSLVHWSGNPFFPVLKFVFFSLRQNCFGFFLAHLFFSKKLSWRLSSASWHLEAGWRLEAFSNWILEFALLFFTHKLTGFVSFFFFLRNVAEKWFHPAFFSQNFSCHYENPLFLNRFLFLICILLKKWFFRFVSDDLSGINVIFGVILRSTKVLIFFWRKLDKKNEVYRYSI